MVAHVLEDIQKALTGFFGQFSLSNKLFKEWLLEGLFLIGP
jgi:hypothetical protein